MIIEQQKFNNTTVIFYDTYIIAELDKLEEKTNKLNNLAIKIIKENSPKQ